VRLHSENFLDVKFAEDADFHAKIRYTVALAWCHSFDPGKPIGEADEILPVVQGGLIGSFLDNAMTAACRLASGDRFHTTLSMTVEFLRAMRPGHTLTCTYAVARATMIGGTVGFAEVTMYRDEACEHAAARASSKGKLAKPAPSIL
jgi:hypothetical protein